MPVGAVQAFWTKVLSKYEFGQTKIDIKDELEELLNAYNSGPMTRQITGRVRQSSHP